MILWDVVFCLRSMALISECSAQTIFISRKIRRQQLNRIASSNDVTLPKDKNGNYISIFKEDLFHSVYF